MSHFNFKPRTASRGYYVYKETAQSYAKINDKVKIEIETSQISIAIDHYACAVKAKRKYFDGGRKDGRRISGNVKSLNFAVVNSFRRS